MIHVNVAWWYAGSLTEQAFREDVDALVTADLKVVSSSVRAWEVTGFEIQEGRLVRDPITGFPIIHKWSGELAKYRQAFAYAADRGLKIHLHLAPNSHPDLSEEDYLYVVQETFAFVAGALSEYVSVWQLWNEVDIRDFRCYQLINSLTDKYCDSFRQALLVAVEEIRKVDPDAHTAINMGGFYGGVFKAPTLLRWHILFSSFSDLIASGVLTDMKLNVYTEGDNEEVVAGINSFAQYGASLWVGEFGICTASRSFDEEDKRRILLDAIPTFREADVEGILLYRMRDDVLDSGCEGSFGIHGRPYATEVLQAMQ